MEMNVCVILPAAGSGERMGLSTPKQFCSILSKPVISYTVDAFERVSWVKTIIVVASTAHEHYVREIFQGQGRVKVITGSSTRHRSIHNGVKAVEQVQPDCDVVVIHDGVRPFITESLLDQVTRAAYDHGAAGVIRPLVSTVIGADSDGFLEESLDRLKYRASEMPQAFRYHTIRKAYEQCTDYDFDFGTECLHLAQRYGGATVKLLDGPDHLWKVTHRKDLYAMEGMIKEEGRRGPICFVNMEDSPLTQLVKKQLRNKDLDPQDVPLSAIPNNCQNLVFQVDQLMDESTKSFISHYVRCNKKASLVAVIVVRERQGNEFSACSELVRSAHSGASGDDHMLFGIHIQNDDPPKAADIVCSLIFERTKALAGQTFIV